MRIEHCNTTTPLAANGVYTSTWQRVSLEPVAANDTDIPVVHHYRRVRGFVVADQGSAVNGVVVQFSRDGTNVHSWVPPQTLVANVPINIDVMLFSHFVRISFTNGAVVQGTFSLYLWLTEAD